MPVRSYIVFSAFIILGLALLIIEKPLKKAGVRFWGTPSIQKFDFITAKIAIFGTWGLFIFKAIRYKAGYIYVPPELAWIATIILCIAVILMIISFIHLGKALRVGLPDGKTMLMTNGIFRYSRNPIYVNVFLITIASCLFFPDLVNVFLAIYGIYYHYKIILAEEDYLAKTFGDEYLDYRKKVRRFF